METARYIVVLIVVTVLAAGMVQAAEQPQAKLSETHQAGCMVKVTCDPAVLPLSFETLDYLLHSSGIGGKAAREILGLSPDLSRIFSMGGYMEALSSDGPTTGEVPAELFRDPMDLEMQGIYEPAAPSTPSAPRPATPAPPAAAGPRSSRARGPQSINRWIIATTPSAPATEQMYLFNLNIRLPTEAKPAAEEFMEILVTNLRNALANAFDEHSLRLKGQLQLAEDEAKRAEDDLRQKQSQLREISGSRVLERNSILGEISNLHNNIQEIERRYATDQVTVDTTAKRIAELQARIQAEMEKDTITDELKRLLELQQVNVSNVDKLADHGRASPTDLADAQEKMTRVRIELVQRQEQLSKSKGGDQIESLNNTLTNLSMGVAQYRTQLAGYEQQLAQAEALLDKADDYELLSLKADVARQNLQEAIVWRDRISRQVRMLQSPAVSVIGGQ